MATTHQDTNVNQLVINKMTKQEYDNLSQVSDTELYLVEEQVDSVVTQNSTNPVQSGAVYNAIQDNNAVEDGYYINRISFGENRFSAFKHQVVECIEVSGEYYLITDSQYTTPLIPTTGVYYYCIDIGNNVVLTGETGDSEFTDVTTEEIVTPEVDKIYIDRNEPHYAYNTIDGIYLDRIGDYVNNNKITLRDKQPDEFVNIGNFDLNQNNDKSIDIDTKVVHCYFYDGVPTSKKISDYNKGYLINGVMYSENSESSTVITAILNAYYYDYLTSAPYIYKSNGYNKIENSYGAFRETYLTFNQRSIYVDDLTNKMYRWDGTDFIMVGGSGEISVEEDSTTNAQLPIIFDDTNNNLKHSSTKMTFNPSNGLIQGACMELTGGRVTGSGDDEGLVISTASNNYAGLCLGSPSGSRSVFYFSTSNGTSAIWRYNNGTGSFDLKHPGTSGTIPVVWTGTLAQYNAITTKNAYTIYLISD